MSASPGHPPPEPGAAADALTGVLGRTGFDEALLREWERARQAQAPLSLLLIDIDYFRAYVDAYRSPQGHDRLKAIAAALLQAVFRPTDVVARYGDDEFAILLPAVHEAGARVVAARVRSQINALAMPHRGGGGGQHRRGRADAGRRAGACGAGRPVRRGPRAGQAHGARQHRLAGLDGLNRVTAGYLRPNR